MKYLIFCLIFAPLLCSCEREATPQEATKTAARTIDQAEAIQKDSQQRTKEADAVTGGK